MGAIEISDQNPLNIEGVNTEILDSITLSQFNDVIAPQTMRGVVQTGGVLQLGYNNIGVSIRGVEGKSLADNQIEISQTTAIELGLKVGDKVDLIIINSTPMRKSMVLVEPFKTNMSDMERSIAFVNIDLARQISGIDVDQISYYSIGQPVDMAKIAPLCEDNALIALTAQERMPQIFDWLKMIDQNMLLVLIIMVIVAIIGIVGATLIVILEHTRTIATLRAVGLRRRAAQKVFVYYMGRIVIKGVICGLATGLAICYAQMWGQIIELDSVSYFVDVIPVDVNVLNMLYLTVGAVVVIAAALFIPTAIIAKMKISESLKYS